MRSNYDGFAKRLRKRGLRRKDFPSLFNLVISDALSFIPPESGFSSAFILSLINVAGWKHFMKRSLLYGALPLPPSLSILRFLSHSFFFTATALHVFAKFSPPPSLPPHPATSCRAIFTSYILRPITCTFELLLFFSSSPAFNGQFPRLGNF